jgi:site-specific DNA-adenine methylase
LLSYLYHVNLILKNSKAAIKFRDYKEILPEHAKEDDFVYTDSPYSPVSSTAYFTKYTNNGFSYQDQNELASVFRKLNERKCKVLLTNSDTSLVRELYSDFATILKKSTRKGPLTVKHQKERSQGFNYLQLLIGFYSTNL